MKETIWALLNIYPVEYTILYLMIGLGMALTVASSVKPVKLHKGWQGVVEFLICVPVGVLTALIVVALWPAYLSSILFGKIRN